MIDGGSHGGDEEQEGGDSSDEQVTERSPEGRYFRYRELVGRGKFKSCHKGFDQQIGIDVAWSKFDVMQLNEDERQAVLLDIQTNLDLEHPNIIKSYKCWRDGQCINLITELFTSGNLRQYRTHYKHLDLKAVKRMARQILRGLQYLHAMQPPIIHGDLRCDKIYVNGNCGEIKVGDIGLATLLPYRWEAEAPSHHVPLLPSSDIFAFGLCILELLTLKQLDPQHCSDWQRSVDEVTDPEARAFVMECLTPPRPTADQLLHHPWLQVFRKMPTAGESMGSLAPLMDAGGATLGDDFGASARSGRRSESNEVSDPASGSGPIAVGKLRGEDYLFEFAGKVRDGKMHFRLIMTQAVAEVSEDNSPAFMRTIDFVFDPDVDTADKLATEISETFNLSPTDTEICAAALKEWLARELPELTENGK